MAFGAVAGRIWFALTADNRSFNAAMNRSSKNISASEKAFRKFQRTIRDLSRSFIGQAGIATAIYGIGNAFRSSIQTFADYEAAMFKVQAVSRATDTELAKLSAKAREMGATTKFSAREAGEGLAFLAQAGFTTSESLEAIGSTLSLAAAGGLELGRAADIASNVVSGFNLEANETARVADVLAAAASRSNTNIEQLGAAMSYVAPIAAALGVELETAAAVIGKLGDAGIQGERAGTATRGILTALADPSGNAQKVLSDLGVAARDLDGNLKPIPDIFAALSRAGFNAADAVKAFEKRNAAAALVISRMSGELSALEQELLSAEGEADRMAETMLKGVAGALTELRSKWEGLNITINEGNSFVEDFIDLAGKAVEFQDKLIRRDQELVEQAHERIRAAGGDRALAAIQRGAMSSGFGLVLPEGEGYTRQEQEKAAKERAQRIAEEARKEIEAIEKREQALKESLAERTQVWKGYWDDVNRLREREAPGGVTGALAGGPGPLPGLPAARQALTGAQSQEAERLNAALIFGGATDAAFQKITDDINTMNTSLVVSEQRMAAFVALGDAALPPFEKLTPRLDALAEAGRRTFEGIGDAIEQAVLQTDSWGDALGRIGRLLAFRALESFFSSDTLKGVFSKRAMGGPVYAGMPTLVGEHGPEILTSDRNAYIVPNGQIGSGGGQTINNITIEGYNQDPRVLAAEVANAVEARAARRQRQMQLMRRNG